MLRPRKHSDHIPTPSGGCCANWSSPKPRVSLVSQHRWQESPPMVPANITLIEEASQTDPDVLNTIIRFHQPKDFKVIVPRNPQQLPPTVLELKKNEAASQMRLCPLERQIQLGMTLETIQGMWANIILQICLRQLLKLLKGRVLGWYLPIQ